MQSLENVMIMGIYQETKANSISFTVCLVHLEAPTFHKRLLILSGQTQNDFPCPS